ncbi:MAG TPA: hypothetical protein VK899_09825 [Gemmatimonadales bacterium]|nr:hypothetical protein [Gemmatimonadales bacterium]
MGGSSLIELAEGHCGAGYCPPGTGFDLEAPVTELSQIDDYAVPDIPASHRTTGTAGDQRGA